jgi:hypothetical protein
LSDTDTTTAKALTERIREHTKNSWIHDFEIGEDKDLTPQEPHQFRLRMLRGIFGTLLKGRSVLVLDEGSGIYPALVAQGGATEIAASSANDATCALMHDVWDFFAVEATAINSRMLSFYDDEPYVDMEHGGTHDFVLVINQVWPLFGASGGSFDAVVESLAFFARHGLVLDWTDAKWATPPPPPEYSLDNFCDALRRKFEYVTVFGHQFVTATGKLPSGGDD